MMPGPNLAGAGEMGATLLSFPINALSNRCLPLEDHLACLLPPTLCSSGQGQISLLKPNLFGMRGCLGERCRCPQQLATADDAGALGGVSAAPTMAEQGRDTETSLGSMQLWGAVLFKAAH